MNRLKLEYKNVKISEIHLEDESFWISKHREGIGISGGCEPRVNVDTPLLRKSRKQYIVIWGHSLVHNLNDRVEELDSFVLDETVSDFDCLGWIVRKIETTRAIDPLERAQVLKWLIDDKQEQKAAELLNINTDSKTVRRILGVLNLDQAFYPSIASGKISGKVIEQLAGFEKSDQVSLAILFNQISASVSLVRELIENLDDLSRLKEKSIAELIQLEYFQVVLKEEEFSPAEKGERIREWIRLEKFPLLSEWEADFQEGLKEADLPKSAKLTHDPYFEKGEFKVEFTFRKRQELALFGEKLSSLAENKEVCEKLKVK